VEVPDDRAPRADTPPETDTTNHHDHHPAADQQPTALKDPVCGMPITAETAAEHCDVNGHTYLFCSPRCAAAFDADPRRYAAATRQRPS
jgi:Cu+-exporting ATPase